MHVLCYFFSYLLCNFRNTSQMMVMVMVMVMKGGDDDDDDAVDVVEDHVAKGEYDENHEEP